jgi:hypothetical protein
VAKESDDPDVIAATMKKPGSSRGDPSAPTDPSANMPNCQLIWATAGRRRKVPASRSAANRRGGCQAHRDRRRIEREQRLLEGLHGGFPFAA